MAGNDNVPVLNGEVLVDKQSAPNSEAAKVHEFTNDAAADNTHEPIKCDVVVVGAGFSGVTAIHRLRKIGKTVKCFESGGDFGGVWYWNRYPGARVDSETPFYQLNIPEVYRNWNFRHRFPDHRELREYFAYIEKVLDLRKDVFFNSRVNSATWDQERLQWTVKTQQGHIAHAKYLLLATGLLHRTYTPDFQGLDTYKGALHHSGEWPENFVAAGKKIAIIGAGATAVQITQELGKQAKELTVLLRRPSYCLPMGQRSWTEEEQRVWKAYYPAIFGSGRDSFAGFPISPRKEGLFDVTEKEREAIFEENWSRGGFHFGLGGFRNVLFDKDANEVAYQFWRRKVCERLTDPEKQKIMAPEKKLYFYGTKRHPLEQDYYDVLNRSNVSIHDLKQVPLRGFWEKGLEMADGSRHEFDAVVLATGFDSYSGSITQMGLKNKDGVDIKDVWKDGISTYLGLTVGGFPNMFMVYSPQAPTPLSNGPTIIESQVEMSVDMIEKLDKEGAASIEAQKSAEDEWKHTLDAMSKMSLLPFTDSWWNGANIPGKKAENMIYIGGINIYEKQCRATFDEWKGFNVVSGKA
ncbi:putative flavin monooxygenase, FAD/NAD(P)-binding domain superfamily [Acrodontium crateriforme]|uniref:Flavin monooxygenase, FAD/NAD(P)-binding domain superfamily n=1 Tax=Acrodontium crateriforme TaxID=150365 RepID=A0AAQ3R3T5_9PEZI|nr:putative flavin monooxygenase, FAD/NAD(P)-binding domain superfamily [Acrodontium crateriforme]